MKILLSPQRRDDHLVVVKNGDVLNVNGLTYDFTLMSEGDTLPRDALGSDWFAADVDRVGGELLITLLLPNPWNYSQEQAFPAPLLDVPDGSVVFPAPLPVEDPESHTEPEASNPGPALPATIDWAQLITQGMKDSAAAAAQLVTAKAELSDRNATALAQISRIQDRIDTISFGIDIGEATPEDEAEQAALAAPLRAWKVYKYSLGKVTTQPGWFESPAWPVEPPIPEIIASPVRAAPETI